MNRLPRFFLILFLLLNGGTASGQGDDILAQYKQGTLSGIVQAHTEADPELEQSGIELGFDPVRAKVTFGGVSRFTPLSKRRFIKSFVFRDGPEAQSNFSTELLFHEDKSEFWLPVREKLLLRIRQELRRGDSVELYAVWVGATYPVSGKREQVFLVNGFKKAEAPRTERAATVRWGTLTGLDRDFTVDFPAEPRCDEFLGQNGRPARSYTVHLDMLMLVLSSEDFHYPPGSLLADSISPAFERKMRAAARTHGWRIVRVRRLSKSTAEVEAWERSRDQEGFVHSISRTHVRNGRVYDLQCRSMYVGREVDRSICNRFLTSFRETGPLR